MFINVVSFWLKGHTVEICSFCSNGNMLVSGSLDTNAKVWDLRIRECFDTLKFHQKKVSALASTQDFRYIVTGSEDGQVLIHDQRGSKPLYQTETNSPVLALDISKSGMIAAGCFDRVARVYSLSAPGQTLKNMRTKMDTMPINCVKFFQDKYLFTGGH